MNAPPLVIPSVAKRSRGTALQTWLRYDPDLVPGVETAYDEFITRSRFGVFFFLAAVASVASVVVVAIVMRGASPAQMTPVVLPVFGITFYGVQASALLRVPRATLATMLAGAVDPLRAVGFGAACGLFAAILETAILLVLIRMHVRPPAPVDFFASGVLFGLFLLLVAAPFVEEFQMQGWLQTRLRGMGGFWAGALATVAFTLMHFPTSPMAFVRSIVLGGAALARGTTRSLGMAIAMHLTNNLVFGVVLVISRFAVHHK